MQLDENMINSQDRILIVDDEQAIRKLLHQKLSKEGYLCEEADSAEQALVQLRNCPFLLVLLDIKMPGKWGTDLLPEIKAAYPNTSVIMFTAIGETNIAIECMKQGADDFISKPFNLDEVTRSVKRTLEKRALQIKIKEYRHNLKEKAGEQTVEIRRLFLGAIEALVFALEAKDKYTGGHSGRVTEIAVTIGNELGLSSDVMEDLRWASLLHDVGKIAVDQMIQNKPGKLTQDEYEHIMIHAHVGAEIVKPVVNDRVVQIIEHHHDYFNGSGLYQVIAGYAIPLGSRILAVADAFDAMTSDRPYRSAMSGQEALDEIQRCVGSQFDPVVASIFMKMKGISKMLAQISAGVD
jgi:putative two-component system response regulator